MSAPLTPAGPLTEARPATWGGWPLLAILLLALGLRLLLWGQPLHKPANDEVEYIAVARDLLAGRGWVFYDSYHWLRAPLYPLFLASSLWLAGGDLHRAALPNIALSVAGVWLAYRLALALLGSGARGVALLSAAITAVLWTNVTFASLFMAETLFTLLFSAGVLCVVTAPGQRGRARLRRVALAGLLLGLATLTRSALLMFLPLVALWLWWALRERQPGAHLLRSLLLPGVFALCVALPIAPWTIRNALAYGEPILVETGLSYNLWVFNEPRESRETIHRALEQIANPAERADYATARGLERLREDPAIVARKLWPNWVFLARIKPIQDRFLLESYYATVDLPLFAAALLFDDLLYLLIALAALAALARGLARRPSLRDPSLLCLAWVGYAIGTMLLTHGEARYRHFLFPVVIPYAALVLGGLWRRERPAPLRLPLRLGLLLVWAIFLWTVLTAYPWRWAAEHTVRGWHTLVGDLRLAAGDATGALGDYERALQAYATPDGWLRVGAAELARGDAVAAVQAYRRAWRAEPQYYVASTRLGDLLRTLGDEAGAREAFDGSRVDAQRVVDWAWRELRPPPRARVEVGDGLDYGYVGGVYPAEELGGSEARWTGGRARLRLDGGGGGPGVLTLRLAAPWPHQAAVPAEVCVGGACRPLRVAPGWRSYQVLVGVPPGAVVVELRSPTFAAGDGRLLGVQVDWVALAVPE